MPNRLFAQYPDSALLPILKNPSKTLLSDTYGISMRKLITLAFVLISNAANADIVEGSWVGTVEKYYCLLEINKDGSTQMIFQNLASWNDREVRVYKSKPSSMTSNDGIYTIRYEFDKEDEYADFVFSGLGMPKETYTIFNGTLHFYNKDEPESRPEVISYFRLHLYPVNSSKHYETMKSLTSLLNKTLNKSIQPTAKASAD